MARPRKPTTLKLISGSRKPDCPVVDLPVISEVPPAPDWMPNAHAVKEWDRLAPILVANKLLTDAGCTTLAHLCAAHGSIVQLYAAGMAPNAAMLTQYRALANDFGLTPAAQGKVKPSGESEKGNPFAKFGRKSDSAAG